MRYSILFIALFFLSCYSSTHTIIVIEDGLKVESYEINKDSVRHGITQKFYPSGKLFELSYYKEGVLDGERLLYFEKGTVEILENYCKGVFCDTLITYFPNGNKRFVGAYTNGEMNGIVKGYYESGELKEEVTFSENMELGPFVEYYKNGNFEWKGIYLNGPNEFGELIHYDSLGVMIKKLMCDSLAICQTFWTLEEGEIEMSYKRD